MSFTPKTERLSKFSEGQTNQNGAVPYFPPPPGSIPEPETKKSTRRPKPPPLPLNRKESLPTPRPQRRSSLRHTTGFPSQSRRRRLQEVHLPAIRLSPRHWILVTLLVLSFAILMMGFIFADCVALPHTDRQDGTTTDDIDTDNITLYVRQLANDPAAQSPQALGNGGEPNKAADTNTSSSPLAPVVSTSIEGPAVPPQTNTTTPAEYLANESKRMGFDSPKNLAILFFYTATLPLLTMLHAITEMIILCCAKRSTATSKSNTSEKRTGTETDIDDPKSNTASESKLTTLIPFLPAVSLTISLLLTGGWIAINTIQFHCELHTSTSSTTTPDPTAGLLSASNQAICPVQTRGHFMHGIHELSVAKNVFGWVLVAVYLAYAAWCVRVNGLVWRRAVEARKARKLREAEIARGGVVRFSVSEPVPEVAGKKKVFVAVNEV